MKRTKAATGKAFEMYLREAQKIARAATKKQRRTRARFAKIPALQGNAIQNIEELAGQINRFCSDKKWTSQQKRGACGHLVYIATLATAKIFLLAAEFPEPFREIAERSPGFPCMYPAHVDDQRLLQKIMLDQFNLGRHHTLKVRAAPGRKTFSTKTWVNKLLIYLIYLVKSFAALADLDERERDLDDHESPFQKIVSDDVPLTPQNAKQWLDAMWEVLLIVIPTPETYPRLRQLGGRPSKTFNVRSAIKEKLGTYLERMLNDQTAHK